MSIHQDIYPFLEKEGAPTKSNLRDALTYYVSNIHYLNAVITSTHRCDLKGQQIEEITPEQKAFAQEKFENALQRIKAKKKAKTSRKKPHTADFPSK